MISGSAHQCNLTRLKSGALLMSAVALLIWSTIVAAESSAPNQANYIKSFEQTPPLEGAVIVPSTLGRVDQQAEADDAVSKELDRGALPDNALRSARAVTDETLDLRITQQAVELVDQGEIERALIVLTEFLDEAPSAHRSRETLATIMVAQGDQLAARRLLDIGLNLAPNFAGFKKLMARLQMITQPQRALDLLAQVPPRPMDDLEYHELYALLLLKTERFDESVARYRALLALDSDNPKLWLAFAIALNATGAIDEALSAHQMASRFGLSEPALDQYNRDRLKSLRGAG